MATIRDYGGTTDPLGSPPLGGPGGWCEAVADKFDEVGADGWVTAARLAADSVTAAKIAANAVGASELADGAVDAAALVDGSVTPAKLSRPIGNLLTDNQARPATTGAYWYSNATETAPGVFSASGAGPLLFTAEFPVTAYTLYTGWADFTTAGRNRVVVLQFVNAANSILLAVQSAAVPGGTRNFATVTAEAPAGAVRAALYPAYSSATPPAGETVTVATAGAWVGAGGLWQMPGLPVPNLGMRPNPSNVAQIQVWNDQTDTWITV